MTVKYSRFRHNAKQTSFTSGPRRQGGEHEHAQYPTNDDVTSGWSCLRPENVSILSSLLIRWRQLSIHDQSQVYRGRFPAWSKLNYFVYQNEQKNLFAVLVPAANTTNNDQFRENTHSRENLWSCLIKHSGCKKRNSRQHERGIIYERRSMNIFQNARLNS